LFPQAIYNVNQLYIGRLELGPKIYIMLDLQGVYQLRCPSSKGNASTYLYVNNITEVLYFLIIYFMGKS
jgi:hypothetical protein